MDYQRLDVHDVVAALDEEQVLLVLAYTRCLRDGVAALNVNGLEDLLQEGPV